MSLQQDNIELSPVKNDTKTNKSLAPPDKNGAADEEDVIIGRFRKISSAKSMAATNGNIQYPTEVNTRQDADLESGLQFRVKDAGERDKLLIPNKSVTVEPSKSQVTKSSFRDVEKPSRFKDQPSATRFQVSLYSYE